MVESIGNIILEQIDPIAEQTYKDLATERYSPPVLKENDQIGPIPIETATQPSETEISDKEKERLNGTLKRVAELYKHKLTRNNFIVGEGPVFQTDFFNSLSIVSESDERTPPDPADKIKFIGLFESIIQGVDHPGIKGQELLAMVEPVARKVRKIDKILPRLLFSRRSSDTNQSQPATPNQREQIMASVPEDQQRALYNKLKALDDLLNGKIVRVDSLSGKNAVLDGWSHEYQGGPVKVSSTF